MLLDELIRLNQGIRPHERRHAKAPGPWLDEISDAATTCGSGIFEDVQGSMKT